MAGLYEEKILGAEQSRELARKLRESGEAIPQGQMVSGWYVPPSIAQSLAGVLKQGIGAYKENQAEDEIKGFKQERARASADAFSQMGMQAPSGLLAEAGTPAIKPSIMDRIGAALTFNAQPKGTPAQPYQQTLVQNPNETQTMGGVLNLAGSNPEMAAVAQAMQGQKWTRENAAAVAKQARQDKIDEAIRHEGFVSGENELNRDNQKIGWAMTAANRQAPQAPSWKTETLANGDMVQIHPQTGEVRPLQGLKGKTSGDGSGMSTQSENKLIAINQQRTAVDSALKAIEAHPEAFSFARGAAEGLPFGETIAGRANTPDETETRSQVFNVVSSVIKERAGTAQSKGEKVTLERFLPSAGDKAYQITAKFKAFKKHLADQEKGIVDYYHPKDKTEVPVAPKTQTINGKVYTQQPNGDWHG
jgi:hypothetical protein